MSGRKGKQNGESSKARKSSKSSESSESSEPSKPSKPSESSESSNPKVVESGSSSSEPETSSDTLADVKDGEGSDESGQETIESQLLALGLAEHHVDPDGNCMFESIARHLHEMNHQVLRQAACDYLQRNSEYSRVWGIEDFENQLNALRQDGEYANDLGDIVPEAIHNVTKRDIVIIQNRQNQISFSSKANITNSTIVIVRRDIHYSSTKPLKSEPKNQEMLDMAPNDNPLRIGGFNVNSLLKVTEKDKTKKNKKDKKDTVAKLISENNLDILVIGETNIGNKTFSKKTKHGQSTLKDIKETTKKKLRIKGFTYVRQDRTFTDVARGGLLVYIKCGIKFTVESFWEWPENNVQFVEISVTIPGRFDLVAIYSPNKKHCQYVINLMKFFLKRNKDLQVPVMFVGDLNLDPDPKQDKLFGEVQKEFEKEFTTRVLIEEKTHGKRCIDHIITNMAGAVGSHPIDSKGISDHKLVMCTVSEISPNLPQPCHGIKVKTLIQPKQCDSKDVRVLMKGFLNADDPRDVCLKLFCEFDKPVILISDQVDVSTFATQIFLRVKTSKEHLIESLVEGIDVRIRQFELKNSAQVVSRQCAINVLCKPPIALKPSVETISWPEGKVEPPKPVVLSHKSLSWTVGEVDCFLLKYTEQHSAEKLQTKYFICTKEGCFKLFLAKKDLVEHEQECYSTS